jgi:protein transport protein SEC31
MPVRRLAAGDGASPLSVRFPMLTRVPLARSPVVVQYGVLAGGLVDGTVNLWNPAKVVGAEESHDPVDTSSGALVASLQKHAGGVRALAPGCVMWKSLGSALRERLTRTRRRFCAPR